MHFCLTHFLLSCKPYTRLAFYDTDPLLSLLTLRVWCFGPLHSGRALQPGVLVRSSHVTFIPVARLCISGDTKDTIYGGSLLCHTGQLRLSDDFYKGENN